MALSMEEQRLLAEIEEHLARLAGRLARHAAGRHGRPRRRGDFAEPLGPRRRRARLVAAAAVAGSLTAAVSAVVAALT